jgi:hypothetical protein
MEFRWIDWNVEHIAEQGVDPEETENVVRTAKPPYPRQVGDDRFLAIGRGGVAGICRLSLCSIPTTRSL